MSSFLEKKRINYVVPILLQAIIYIFSYALFKSFGHFHVKGLENMKMIPRERGIIFAANHSSEWDGILIRASLPFFSRRFSPMYYVARARSFYKESSWRVLFYGGTLFKLLGAYPAYSGNKDYSFSLQHFMTVLNLKRNISIFPEGRRTRDGTIGVAHGGVAFLAQNTLSSVVPVAITGLVNLTLFDFLLRRRHVSISFGKPFENSVLFAKPLKTAEDYRLVASHIMGRVEDMLRQTIN